MRDVTERLFREIAKHLQTVSATPADPNIALVWEAHTDAVFRAAERLIMDFGLRDAAQWANWHCETFSPVARSASIARVTVPEYVLSVERQLLELVDAADNPAEVCEILQWSPTFATKLADYVGRVGGARARSMNHGLRTLARNGYVLGEYLQMFVPDIQLHNLADGGEL